MEVQKQGHLPSELLHNVFSNLKDDAKSLAAMSETDKHSRANALYTFSTFPEGEKQQQLLKAVLGRDEKTVRFILSSRINPELINKPTNFQHGSHNAWACAVSGSRKEIVSMLASYPGAVPTTENLRQALLHYDSSLFPIMLNKALSANPNLLQKEGTSFLNSAIGQMKHELIPSLIHHAGVDINNTLADSNQTPPLGRAIQRGDKQSVSALLNSPNIDVNKGDRQGNTPLHIVLSKDLPSRSMTESLLNDRRLNPNLKNASGQSPLHMRSRFSGVTFMHNQYVKTLSQPDMKPMKLLLSRPDVDVNLQDTHKGDTALHICAKSGNSQGIALLLSHPNINLNVKNRQGETARDVAKRYKNPEISQMLKQDNSLMSKVKNWKI